MPLPPPTDDHAIDDQGFPGGNIGAKTDDQPLDTSLLEIKALDPDPQKSYGEKLQPPPAFKK